MALQQELGEGETIIETWTIQDLEDYKWQLMLNNMPWDACIVQMQIDEIILDKCLLFDPLEDE